MKNKQKFGVKICCSLCYLQTQRSLLLLAILTAGQANNSSLKTMLQQQTRPQILRPEHDVIKRQENTLFVFGF